MLRRRLRKHGYTGQVRVKLLLIPVGGFAVGAGIKIVYYSLLVPFYFSLINLLDAMAIMVSGVITIKEGIT